MTFINNTLSPRQNIRHFPDDTLKGIFLNENVIISIKISLKFVPKGPINNIPALVQIMAWRRPGDKPLSKAMMVSLLTHICVTRPQWVKLLAAMCSGRDQSIKHTNLSWYFLVNLEFTTRISKLITLTLQYTSRMKEIVADLLLTAVDVE